MHIPAKHNSEAYIYIATKHASPAFQSSSPPAFLPHKHFPSVNTQFLSFLHTFLSFFTPANLYLSIYLSICPSIHPCSQPKKKEKTPPPPHLHSYLHFNLELDNSHPPFPHKLVICSAA
ncbi:hypothetical protein ACJQWK_02272 [Exserohilum turcicum]